MHSGENCDNCGMPLVFFTRSFWSTDNELWVKVTGLESGILCPPCFTDLARSKGIHIRWKAVIQ
jgi:hypothetical protein